MSYVRKKSPRSRAPGAGSYKEIELLNSADAAGENTEERLDVRVSTHVAVAVEVGVRGAGCAAGAAQAGEEGLDVRVGAHVPVAVVVVTAAVSDAAAGGRLDAEVVAGVVARARSRAVE